jgi:hypothetical protein
MENRREHRAADNSDVRTILILMSALLGTMLIQATCIGFENDSDTITQPKEVHTLT